MQATLDPLGSLVGMQRTERHPHGLLSREGTFGGKLKSRQQKGGFWLGSLQPVQGRRAFPGWVRGQRPESGQVTPCPCTRSRLRGEGSPAAAGTPLTVGFEGLTAQLEL